MAVSPAAAALCASPEFLNNSLNIVNLDKNVCFYQTSHSERSGHATMCHQYWFTDATNITAVPPANETSTDIWIYRSSVDLSTSIPISKPLLVDCPMPVCAFGISGTYADMQRYLIYLNVLLCIIASLAPVLRGVAQIYLATTGISSAVNFVTIFELRHTHIVDMDFLPSLMYFFSGMTATLLWVLLRSTNKVNSYGDAITLQVLLPFIFVIILLVTVILMLKEYKLGEPIAVLLDSKAAFRLTSVCFQDSIGLTSMWAGPLSYPIRQPGELQYLLPSVESHGRPANAFPVSIPSTLKGVGIVLGAILGYTCILGCMSLCGCQISISTRCSLYFLRHTPKAFRKM
jgi:hypothetical protein